MRSSIKKSQGSTKLLTGLSFCQTEPDLLTDWAKLSRSGDIQARLFTQSNVTFHPKVLLIETSARRIVVVGSGNLSGGGFLGNIECSLFSDSDDIFERVNAWFDRLFQDDELTSDLRDRDVTRYRKRFDAARQKNKEVQELQQSAEDESGNAIVRASGAGSKPSPPQYAFSGQRGLRENLRRNERLSATK